TLRQEFVMSTVAEQLVEVLIQAGVARVYGVVGDSLNPFVDAIRRTEGIEWIHVRNEEAGAFAAAAEAHLTGRLAVCAGSCGPGNTHLIQGLYDAHRSGVPVLAIASHITAEHPTGPSAPVTVRGAVVPADHQVRELADRLNAARTVTLFCGAGVQGSHDAVMALAGKLHRPVGHSLRGKEWIQ